ncbi:MAG TPA: multicopper oxidase domain-containing protein [Candidatus Aquilonibacter sp.]|nr:multicopper oxidase domain-containing protein [Candidatus Aquilonibacter sp.]
MSKNDTSRRKFLKLAGTAGAILASGKAYGETGVTASISAAGILKMVPAEPEQSSVDYTLHIGAAPIEIAPKNILSTIAYNGQFPGPLLRFKEGHPVTVEIHNDTDTPEQLHWHGQFVPTDVDGAAEEGTPFIPAHGMRRITFTPRPSGFRFYHTHNHARADLHAGQYSGQVGPVYIEAKNDPGDYDREVFLVLKEFEPFFSQGGDVTMDFLAPTTRVRDLQTEGEWAMRASLAKGMPHGYEVGYRYFTINGRMLGHGEPVRVKRDERVLFHILNGSATEIRSLALPGHTFKVVALDGNSTPVRAEVPVLWLGTAERICAIVEMNHPGVWVMGDLADDDRGNGMGIVVEYAGQTGDAVWQAPPSFRWNYALFGEQNPVGEPDELIDMIFTKRNAGEHGFNLWAINDRVFPDGSMTPVYHLHQGKRYRLRMHNATDDIHPIHLHRHSFELTKLAGTAVRGVMKDVMMVGGYQEMEVDFVADDPGLTLFHCHQQLHMDFGFMTLFDYV